MFPENAVPTNRYELFCLLDIVLEASWDEPREDVALKQFLTNQMVKKDHVTFENPISPSRVSQPPYDRPPVYKNYEFHTLPCIQVQSICLPNKHTSFSYDMRSIINSYENLIYSLQ